MAKKILFICKRNEVYSVFQYLQRCSGLYNSTRFIVESLVAQGVDAAIIEVNDNNDIDREVTKYKPDIVVIEALWVVPSKFTVLQKLHPSVYWCVHLHSKIPFLALESMAIAWLSGYSDLDIKIIVNSEETLDALEVFIPSRNLVYLSNVYIEPLATPKTLKPEDSVNIGCFGAIRPMKNQLLQAIAAIKFANDKQVKLNFYINGPRVETGGEPVLKNLKALFATIPSAKLVIKPWLSPEDFLKLLRSTIDLGMQVSLTETWNIISCDYVASGLPVVVSKEIPWVDPLCVAADSVDDIVNAMNKAWDLRILISLNQFNLEKRSTEAQRQWYDFVIWLP